MDLKLLEKYDNRVSLTIFGDVRIVLEGKVSDQNVFPLDLKKCRFALGAGSYSDLTKWGETIILESRALGSYVSNASKLITEEEKKKLRTPFLLGLDSAQKVSSYWELNNKLSGSLLDLYSLVSKHFSYGGVIVGDFLFETLEGSYLKKSSTEQENINVYKEKYWEKPAPLMDQRGFTYGVIITDAGKKKFPPSVLQKAFYENPNEKEKVPLMSHSHVALTVPHGTPKTLSDFSIILRTAPILGVRHLLTQSKLKEGVFLLFEIDEILASGSADF